MQYKLLPMRLRLGLLTGALLVFSCAAFAQNNNPSFQTKSGTYYFTNKKPIVLKWGDTHFFHDSITRKRKSNGDTTDNYTINSVVDAKYAKADISIYPNPFINTINIKCDKEGDLQVELMDISGKYTMRKTLSAGERRLDLSGLASSSYLLKVYDANNQLLQTFKIEKIQ